MTTQQITARIQTLQTEIAAERSRANDFEASYKSWLAASQEPCSGTGKKKQSCLDDRAYKARKASEQKNTSLAALGQIATKEQELATLQATLKSQNAQAETLASKGISLEGELIKANASAEATTIKAAQEAQTQASAERSAQTRKTALYVLFGVATAAIVFAIIKSKISQNG